MPNSSIFFTRLASVYLALCLVKRSVAVIWLKSNVCPTVKFGKRLSAPSSFSSSSVPSKYTFKNPSNFITSPLAVNSCSLVLISIFATVFSKTASLICEAIVRFQINSYNFVNSGSFTKWFSIYEGRMASCASCALSFLFLYLRICIYLSP